MRSLPLPPGEGSADDISPPNSASHSLAAQGFARFPSQSAVPPSHPAYTPPHPVDGEGVGSTLLDGGGLWSSDEARAEESPGGLEGGDGSRPPARRALLESGLLTSPSRRSRRHVRPASSPATAAAEIRLGPKRGPPTGGRVENGRAGRRSRRNGKNTSAPGEPRPPRSLPNRSAKRRTVVRVRHPPPLHGEGDAPWGTVDPPMR